MPLSPNDGPFTPTNSNLVLSRVLVRTGPRRAIPAAALYAPQLPPACPTNGRSAHALPHRVFCKCRIGAALASSQMLETIPLACQEIGQTATIAVRSRDPLGRSVEHRAGVA